MISGVKKSSIEPLDRKRTAYNLLIISLGLQSRIDFDSNCKNLVRLNQLQICKCKQAKDPKQAIQPLSCQIENNDDVCDKAIKL